MDDPWYQSDSVTYEYVLSDMKKIIDSDNIETLLQHAFLEMKPPIKNNEFGSSRGYATFIRPQLVKLLLKYNLTGLY